MGAWPSASRLKAFGSSTEINGAISRDEHGEADHRGAEASLRVGEQERDPARDAEVAADAFRRYFPGEVDGGAECRVELRHQAVRRRGSRTRLSTSMSRFATITQTESTTSRACARA